MRTSRKEVSEGLTRREALKLSGLALGGLAFGGAMAGPGAGTARAQSCPTAPCYPTERSKTEQYTYGPSEPFIPGTKIGSNEMRITFLGSMFPPPRRANQEMSIFVEVGDAKGEADQFVFDCGSGVCSNYDAMLIGYGKMDKVFISHLHGDHMSDLTHIYCFGPSGDRKSPLYVWGPSPSGVRSPKFPYRLCDDGTNAYCRHLREAMRWHTESFSFQTTSYASYQPPTRASWGLPVHPIPVGDDSRDDGYALVPIQLDWRKYGKVPGDNVAYNNPKTGVKITHFPVIHTRQGSIGYKLEWNGLSMIYTSDTRPETHCIEQANNGGNGVDVFIHEMILPPELMAMKDMRLPEPLPYPGPLEWKTAVDQAQMIEDSSHSPQGAFGYVLSQITPRPRLTVATHFPVADDTVECAVQSVLNHCPDIRWQTPRLENDNIAWSVDLMVISVTAGDPKPRIVQKKGVVNDYGWPPLPRNPDDMNPPKYWKWGVDEQGNPAKVGDPTAQLDTKTLIQAEEDGKENYCSNGY